MGCCASRPASTAPNEAAHSSSRNITAPSRPGSTTSQTTPHPSSTRPDAPSRPNTPLKPLSPTHRSRLPNTLASPLKSSRSRIKPLTDSTNLTWTRARLDKERTDWWDTQVSGDQEIWAAIRLATQHLQVGEVQEAQTMLDVTGCNCPTGCLWKGVYDDTGVMYKVPEWLVVEPEGLVDEEDEEAGPAVSVDKSGDDEEDDDEGEEEMQVRIRDSKTQRDVKIMVRRKEVVGSVVEKFRVGTKRSDDVKIRLAYGGRLYAEFETLEAHPHWDYANEYVVNALVLG